LINHLSSCHFILYSLATGSIVKEPRKKCAVKVLVFFNEYAAMNVPEHEGRKLG
jgi:hypothetical protein